MRRYPRPSAATVETLESRWHLAVGTLSEQIIVDQFGWRADAPRKVVLFADPITGQNSAIAYTPGAQFQVRRTSDDGIAFTGSTVSWKAGQTDAVYSGDKVWSGDFSALTTPGEYYVYDPTNNRHSFTFKLDNNLFNDVLKTSVRTFYYQRTGTAIPAQFGGNWTHAIDHVGPNQDTQARLWQTSSGGPVAGSTVRDVSGGWFDAGDYNKYVPYTTDVMWNLLQAYEWNPTAFGDNWNIPESGNGAPDVLDEIKWELEWLRKMQLPNGSVMNRVANPTFNAGNFDPATDNQARYYTAATTWATASFAASLAHASRVFAAFPTQYPGYAQTLRTAAENAWANLQLPANASMNPASGNDGGGTSGGGGQLAATGADSNANGDRRLRVLAAAELWKTTGTAAYKTYFEANYKNPNTSDNGFHPLLDGTPRFDASGAADLNRAYVTYATTSGASAPIVNEIKAALLNNLDESWLQLGEYNNATDPYRGFMWSGHYHWGSNKVKSEWANVLIYAIKLNVGSVAQRNLAREVAEEYLHYIHGRNPLSQNYLSNMGTKGVNLGGDKSAMEVYHSWFGHGSSLYDGASSTHGPIPGYLVGGPNKDFSIQSINPPGGQPPMKAFRDWNTGWPENSWEITEPAIYYQAAYSLLLSQFSTTAAPSLPAWLAPGSAATWNAGSKVLTVNGAATIVANPGADDPVINAAGGGAVLTINPTSALHVHAAALNLSGGATARLTSLGAARTASNHRVLIVDSISIDAGSTLDLTDNDLVVDYTGASPIADIEADVRSGYNVTGNWAGFGITSSIAQLDNNFTVAVADNALLAAPFGSAQGGPNFAGVNVDLGSVLLKFTHRADLNLDGLVTPDDSAVFGANYDANQFARWSTGDLNLDGLFTPDDTAIFGGSYDESLELL